MKNKVSIIKRRVTVVVFILLFLVLAPTIVFYANGNILGKGWNILATGGLFINSMQPDSKLYVNGKLKETTSFFTRNYFLKNLKPGVYVVSVKKDGYNDWSNKIKVFANKVTESKVFMLPSSIDITEIKKSLEIEKILSTTTIKETKLNPNYEIIKNLFDEDLTLKKYISVLSTTTDKTTKYAPGVEQNPISNRHLSIWREGNSAYIGWEGSLDSSPGMFCEETQKTLECEKNLKIFSFEDDINNLDFFPGESEVIIVAVSDKIFAVEAENNPEKKLQMIYEGNKPDFRILNNNIYINDGEFFGQVEI